MSETEDRKPSFTELKILRRLRDGETLAEGTSKYEVAQFNDNDWDEVELSLIERLEEAGWVYVIGEMKSKRSWKLTRKGWELFE